MCHKEQLEFLNIFYGHNVLKTSREAFCLRMLHRGTFNVKNHWYAPAPRVRVHFPPIFEYPKCKAESRNKTMAIFARNPLRITVVFLLFALYNLSESVEKSKFGCLVCKKKSQLRPFQKVKAYTKYVESCFGIRTTIDDNLIICKACRRVLQEHRRTGKSFHHVSAVSNYL